jgi:hypothetical protein
MIYSFYFEGGMMDGEVVLTDFAAPNGSPPRSAAWIDFTLGGAVGLSFPVGDVKNVDRSAAAEKGRGLSPVVAGTGASPVAEQKGTVPLSSDGSRVGAKDVGPSGTADCSKAGESDSGQQVYQVVYRDQNAGTVIVRCRYVPMLEMIPPGVKRIIFAFVGGFRNGSTDEFTIAPSDNENRRVEHPPWREPSPVVAGTGASPVAKQKETVPLSADGSRICSTPEFAGSRARYLLTESGTIGKRFGAGSDVALQMLKDDGPEATRNTGAMLQIYEIAGRSRDGDDLRLQCRFIRTE